MYNNIRIMLDFRISETKDNPMFRGESGVEDDISKDNPKS